MLNTFILFTTALTWVNQLEEKPQNAVKAAHQQHQIQAERVERLRHDFTLADAGAKAQLLQQLEEAVVSYGTMLRQAFRQGEMKAHLAGRKLEQAYFHLADAHRETGDVNGAENRLKKAGRLNRNTAQEINRGLTHAFYFSKTQPQKTLKLLEGLRAQSDFLKTTLIRGREEIEVLRQLARLYTLEGKVDKAVETYEQYFDWLLTHQASIDALELRKWSTYNEMAKRAKTKRSEAQREAMGARLRALNRSLLDRESFQTKLLIEADEEQSIWAKNFEAFFADQ